MADYTHVNGHRRKSQPAPSLYEQLRDQVVEVLKRSDIDAMDAPQRVYPVVDEVLSRYQSGARTGLGGHHLAHPDQYRKRLLDAVLAWGPLTDVLKDHTVEEIFIQGDDAYYIDAEGRFVSVPFAHSEAEHLGIVRRLLNDVGAEITERRPQVAAQVLDGRCRLTASMPPISDRLDVTMRKYTMKQQDFAALVKLGALPRNVAELLIAAVHAGAGIAFCGPPGSGKTTMADAALRAVPPTMIVRCCEEVRELAAPLAMGGYMRTRAVGADGSADTAVTLRDLVRFVLGMRPDLIVVGEIKGVESYEILRAGNAGCGVLTTVHSNGTTEALSALHDLALMAGENVPSSVVRSRLTDIFQLVVFADREDLDDGSRRRGVFEVGVLPPQAASQDFVVVPLFQRASLDEQLTWTENPVPDHVACRLDRVLRRRGVTATALCQGQRAGLLDPAEASPVGQLN